MKLNVLLDDTTHRITEIIERGQMSGEDLAVLHRDDLQMIRKGRTGGRTRAGPLMFDLAVDLPSEA